MYKGYSSLIFDDELNVLSFSIELSVSLTVVGVL